MKQHLNLSAYIVECYWLDSIEYGWGNGYVLLPEGHKYFGVKCEDIPYEVHGGITFSELDENGFWAIGFDTVHYQDNERNRSKFFVIQQTLYLLSQAERDL